MSVKETVERFMQARGIENWYQLAKKTGLRPDTVYLVRDGREKTAQFGTICAIVAALDMTFSEFFADEENSATVNLGGVLKALGDYAGAKEAYQRALVIIKKKLGPDHPNTKFVRGNLESLGK